MVPIAIGIAL